MASGSTGLEVPEQDVKNLTAAKEDIPKTTGNGGISGKSVDDIPTSSHFAVPSLERSPVDFNIPCAASPPSTSVVQGPSWEESLQMMRHTVNEPARTKSADHSPRSF